MMTPSKSCLSLALLLAGVTPLLAQQVAQSAHASRPDPTSPTATGPRATVTRQRTPAPQPAELLERAGHGAWTTEDGDVVAEASDWRASFNTSAAALRVPSPDGGVEPEFELHYQGHGRGASWSPAAADAAPSLADSLVRYQHANVTERYRVGARGFEQSFVFDTAPAGSGDLVIRMAVSGNVQAEAVAAAHQAITFSANGSRVIRYGEAVAFGRGGQRVRIATRYDGNSSLELIVPAALVDNATYPLIVDPAVGPIFNPGGSAWSDTNPDVSYDGDHERYMVVWQRAFSATSIQVRGQIFKKDGSPHSGLIQITSSGINTNPALSYVHSTGDNEWLVAWQESDRIRAQMRDGNTGAAAASVFDVSFPAPGERDARPDVAGHSFTEMWVGWDRTPSGFNDANEILVNCFDFTSVGGSGSSGERSVVTVPFNSGHVRRVRLGEGAAPVFVGGLIWSAVRATWGRWYNSPAPGDTDIWTASFRYQRFTGQFVQIDPASSVPGGADVGPDEVTPDIGMRWTPFPAPLDDQQLIVWEDEGDIRGHMYDLNGPIGSPITVRATSASEVMPAVGAGYCEFTVAYGEIIPPNEFDVGIRAARVLLDGSVPVNDRPIDVGTVPFQGGLRASSRAMTDFDSEPTNTSLLVWWGQTGPSTGLNDIRARFFEPVAPNESPFGSPCPGPQGELPTIGTLNGPANPGNENMRITVNNAPNNTLAVLLIGDILTTIPLPTAPGCNLYLGLPAVNILPAVVNNSGFGSVLIDWPCSIPSGTTLAFQWGIYTPGHNALGWITSNDLDITWSQF